MAGCQFRASVGMGNHQLSGWAKGIDGLASHQQHDQAVTRHLEEVRAATTASVSAVGRIVERIVEIVQPRQFDRGGCGTARECNGEIARNGRADRVGGR
jgi:hypothetical protein